MYATSKRPAARTDVGFDTGDGFAGDMSLDALDEPFPARGASALLHDRLVRYLSAGSATPGTPFPTDAELVERTKLSRSTVRRALENLTRDGWIRREVGRGSFVGPRAATMSNYAPARSRPVGTNASAAVANAESQKQLRLAVMVFDVANIAHDWYSLHVLAGIDAAAANEGLRVELLGAREGDAASIVRRLEQDRPDVFASLATRPQHVYVMREAQHLGVPTLAVVGSPVPMNAFGVVEDNDQGTRLALDHLAAAGHTQIGFCISRYLGQWVFDRHAAYEHWCEERGIEPVTLWYDGIEYLDESPNAWRRHERVLTERTERWLNRHKPTAVLSGHYLASEVLGNALGKMNMRCPADLSVVTFDQHPYNERWLHARPTTVALPLEAMGRWMAESARGVAEGAAPPPLTVLPCELTEGETVRPV